MRVSIASDHAGFEQKQALAAYLRKCGYEVVDHGPENDDRVDYPDYAVPVARDVAEGAADRGVLVCGTGIGMAMADDAGLPPSVLNVDGGASANDFLMQFQADMLGVSLRRPANAETTALGAAFLAGLTTGFWESTAELAALREGEERFLPTFDDHERAERLEAWRRAIERVCS